MKQLTFDLQTTENINPYSKENFVEREESFAAFNFLEKFFSQKNFSQAQFPSLTLKGSAASGKTHLLHIFAQKYRAKFLLIEEISHQNLSTLFEANQFFILEDVNKIKDEELLLHLINSAYETKSFLILSSQNKNEFHLKDLNSRIKNIFSLQIKDPTPETIELLLVNAFSRRQIRVSSKVINLISNNIDRSYGAISDVVNLIDLNCRESNKNITMQVVAEILNIGKSGLRAPIQI